MDTVEEKVLFVKLSDALLAGGHVLVATAWLHCTKYPYMYEEML